MVNCQGRAVKLPGSICQDKFCDFKETPFRHQGFSADRRQHPNQHNVFTSDIHQLTKSIHGLAKMSLDMDRQEPVDWQLTMSPSFGGRISRNYRNYTTLGCRKTLQSMVSLLSATNELLQPPNFSWCASSSRNKQNNYGPSTSKLWKIPSTSPGVTVPGVPRSLVLKDALAQGRHDLVDAPAGQGLDLWGETKKPRRPKPLTWQCWKHWTRGDVFSAFCLSKINST